MAVVAYNVIHSLLNDSNPILLLLFHWGFIFACLSSVVLFILSLLPLNIFIFCLHLVSVFTLVAFPECLAIWFFGYVLKRFNSLLSTVCLRSVLQSDWVKKNSHRTRSPNVQVYLFLWKISGFLEKKNCHFSGCVQFAASVL